MQGRNLEQEMGSSEFEEIYEEMRVEWNEKLKVAEVEGGTEDEKAIVYTALYHAQIHPNILNDVNGEYPKTGGGGIGRQAAPVILSFHCGTLTNYHQLMTLLYPEEQLDIVKSMLAVYDGSGWLPKWELNSTETLYYGR